MQVSVETVSSLQRRMTVQVPAERIDQEVDRRLRSLMKRVRIDGFRPGKVPLKEVQRRYGAGVFQEVMGEVVQSSYQEAIAQEKLQPAGGPNIEPKTMGPGKGLEYVATFEVFPAVELADLGQVEAVRPQVEIAEADVDKVIETLRRQHRTFTNVDRPARQGDQMILDFEGRLDGEAFDGGKAESALVELGEGRMLPAFEHQLEGLVAGEERTIDVSFPEGYPAEKLAGRTAQFDIRVLEVKEPSLPAVDEDFARLFGIEEGGVPRLREEVRANMQREVDQTIKNRVKGQVMDALYKVHTVELPEALVREEIDRLRQQAGARFGQQAQGQNFPDGLFTDEARRRVALGLIIRELVRANNLSVDPDKVRAALETMAAGYEDPRQVINYYRTNPQAMNGLESVVLEEEVVDWVVTQARVTDKPMSFDELMNPQKEGQPE